MAVLHRRGDERVAEFLQVASLQPVSPDVLADQGISVLLRDPVPGEGRLLEEGIAIGVGGDQVDGEPREIARGDALLRVVVAGGLAKRLAERPSSAALAFIRSTNERTFPTRPSARAMAASLPDWTMTPSRRSSTDTALPSRANMEEPPDRAPPAVHASREMSKSWSACTSPSAIALKTSSTVMSFARLAGWNGSSAAFSKGSNP
jgi:hypothetical protein